MKAYAMRVLYRRRSCTDAAGALKVPQCPPSCPSQGTPQPPFRPRSLARLREFEVLPPVLDQPAEGHPGHRGVAALQPPAQTRGRGEDV